MINFKVGDYVLTQPTNSMDTSKWFLHGRLGRITEEERTLKGYALINGVYQPVISAIPVVVISPKNRYEIHHPYFDVINPRNLERELEEWFKEERIDLESYNDDGDKLFGYHEEECTWNNFVKMYKKHYRLLEKYEGEAVVIDEEFEQSMRRIVESTMKKTERKFQKRGLLPRNRGKDLPIR
ncbi:hypothetical protein HYT56_05160 [Candidatus Woesearchaeota archaeon]|nr:hypothetical protein [Candidatus Woesearchaeota archaeon]